MASIITATTTSGLTQSADNSGVLQLASGTGNLVTIPSVTGTAMVSGNMPAFSAYYNGSQTNYSAATWTKLTLNAEDFDTASCFDSTTNYRFTPNVAGYYQITLTISAAQSGSTTNSNNLAIYKNGSLYKGVTNVSITGQYYGTTISLIIYMNGSTDYVEGYTYMGGSNGGQYFGSSYSSFGGAGSNNTVMTGCLIRTA